MTIEEFKDKIAQLDEQYNKLSDEQKVLVNKLAEKYEFIINLVYIDDEKPKELPIILDAYYNEYLEIVTGQTNTIKL
jgi:hypothetical protein